MPSNRFTYTIGFNADTSQLKASLNEVLTSLRQLGTRASLSKELQEASRMAIELGQNLQSAINPQTGRFDLGEFHNSLKQSGRTLQDYYVSLSSLGTEGTQTFLNLARAISSAEAPLMRSNRLLNDLWITMRNTARWQISASALSGFTNAISTAYNYAQDLNESLTNIRIVTERSTEDMKEFADYANNAARNLSTTTTEYTDAALIYYQQGLPEEEVQARTETTIRLAQAAGISAQEASEELTAIWNNFYDGSQSLEYYADVLVRLGADTASSSEEISEGIQQFASVADAVGLSYEYAASALATITATTRESANTVGTALRTLFARFQGLQLGETLEDGVDLNKYSSALAAVGVQVLDVNGDLREMDSILNDLGSVWETLSSAQQVALAQTVAGVRQYTRLVALMDNWDFFQENLASAQGAEGSLQVQADIYADSWEAARNRVTAAAEDIYDSLINDQFFIDLDNSLTGILSFIANLIDSIGGLGGVLTIAAGIMTKVFSNQIAESIQRMAYNARNFMGITKENTNALREQAAQYAILAAQSLGSGNDVSLTEQSLSAKAQIVQVEAQISDNASRYTELQRTILQQDIQRLNNNQQLLEVYGQQADEAQKIANTRYDTMREGLNSNLNRNNDYLTAIQGQLESGNYSESFVTQIEEMFTSPTSNINNVDQALAALTDGMEQAARRSQELRAVQQALNNTLGDTSSAANMVRQFQLLGENADYSDAAINNYLNSTNGLARDLNDATSALGGYQNLIGSISTNYQSGVTAAIQYSSQIQTLNALYRAGTITGEEYNRVLQRLQENMRNPPVQWADVLSQAFSTAASTAMAVQGITNLSDALQSLNEEGTDTGQAWLTIGTNLTMIIPVIFQLVNAVRTAATAVTSFGAAVKLAIPILGLLVIGITAVVEIVDALTVSQEEAQEAIQQANQAYEDAKNEVSSLTSELESLNAQIEELQNQKTLSITDKEDLRNLSQQKVLLEQQLAIQEQIAKVAQEERIRTAIENWDTAYGPLTADTTTENKREFLNPTTGQNEWLTADEWWNQYGSVTEDQEYALEYYNTWVDGNVEANQRFISSYQETYTQLEQIYSDMVEAYLSGSDLVSEEQLNSYLSGLQNARFRMSGYDEGAYLRTYITPVLDAPELDSISAEIYNSLVTEDGSVVFNQLTDSAKEFLLQAGISAEEFGDILNEGVDSAVENMSQLEGYSEDALNNLTAEDWEALLSLNWDNLPEDIDSIYDVIEYAHEQAPIELFDEGNIETVQDLLDQINEAQDPLRSALETYREQGFLNINDVQNLIADNPEYSAFIQALGEGRYALTEDALSAYQNMARAEEQALNQQLQENLSAIYPDSSYLEGYLNTWQEIYDQYSDRSFATAIEQIQEVTQAYQDNGISAAEYFSQIRESVASNIGDWLSFANTDIDSGIFANVDLARDIFTILSTQIATGIEDTQKAFDVGWIDYETYFDGIVEGSSALIDLYQDYYSGLVIAEDGQAGFLKSMDDLTKAEKEMYEHGKITNEMLKDREDLSDEQAAAADRVTLAYQNLTEAQSQQPFVDFADQYADLFFDATIDGTLQLDLYADASIANEDEVNAMLDDFGVRISTRLNELYQKDDKTAYNEAIAMLQSYGIQVEATGDHTAAEITQAAANNLAGLSALMTDVQGNTETTLGNLLGNVGTIMSAIGTIISNFDYTITMESEQTKPGEFNLAKWVLSGGKSGIQLPDFKYEITGVAGTEMQSGIDALTAAGQDIAANREDYGSIIGGALGGNIWDQYSQGDNENPVGGNFPNFPEGASLDPNSVPDDFYDDQTGGGGGGGGSDEAQEYEKEELQLLEEIQDRYHEINRELERQERILEDIDESVSRSWGISRLQNYERQIEELNEQQDLYNQKLEEAYDWLATDRTNLTNSMGLQVTIGADGEIENYSQLEEKINSDLRAVQNEYNAFIDEYNALTKAQQEARQAEYEAWQDRLEEAQQLQKDRLDAISQYEETVDTILDLKDSIEETERAIADARLGEIEHRLEIRVTISDMEQTVRDLARDIEESFGDLLTHGIPSTNLSYEQAQSDMSMLAQYQQTYNEYQNELANATDATDIDAIISNLEDLQGQIVSTAGDLLNWIDTLENLFPDALADAAERLAEFTDQLDHNESIANSIQQLYELQGLTVETEQGFNAIQSALQEQLDAQVNRASINRQWYQNTQQRLAEAEAALIGVAETDPDYDRLKNIRDALLEEYNSAQEAMLEDGIAAIQTAQEMYQNAIENAIAGFDDAVSNGMGLDNLSSQYDRFIEQEERYLDKVNEAYEVASWYNQLQNDIDNTTNSAMRDRLEALQEEIDIRRENNTLSQYDLDILEAKYQVLQAQMALEDAQNNRNQMRLVRDSQGNWNYQYTVDADQIAEAEQNLLDAENDWYNIAKDQVTDITGEIISTWQECEDAIREIYTDMTLSDEERSQRAQEIYQYYADRIKYLENEKQVAIADMNEAGNELLLDSALSTGADLSDITGLTADDIKDIIEQTGMDINDLLASDSETIKDIMGENADAVDIFKNTYADSLDEMTSATTDFEDILKDALQQSQDAYEEYGDTLKDVSEQTGVSLDDLAQYLSTVSTSTDRLADAASNASDEMWKQLDAIKQLSDYYGQFNDQIMATINSMKDLANQITQTAQSESQRPAFTPEEDNSLNPGYNAALDYNDFIHDAIANGWISYGDETYRMLNQQRENKIDDLNLTQDEYIIRQEEAQRFFQNAQGDTPVAWTNESQWRQMLELLQQYSTEFQTGGYTGSFDDAKLAFLHEKELVLNQQDTANILAAVESVRSIGPSLFEAIERQLDGNAMSARSLMASIVDEKTSIQPVYDTIEQSITIERVEFPNVTSSREIEEAFASLADDAVQWARRRKG